MDDLFQQLPNNKSWFMSTRHICKSKFNVCYHFLDIMKILGEKTFLSSVVT